MSNGSATSSRNPTPIDTLFILFAAAFLMLILLWIAGQLSGNQNLFTQLPSWAKDAIESVWSKVLLGAGTAGALALRKWMYGTRPTPNYLLWIPGFMIFFGVALFLAKQLMPAPVAAVTSHYSLPIKFSAKATSPDSQTSDPKVVSFWERAPEKAPRPVYLEMDNPKGGLYSNKIDVPNSGPFEAEVTHRAIGSSLQSSTKHDYECLLCVKNNPKKPFPAGFAPETAGTVLRLSCGNEVCVSENPGAGYW